MSKNVVTIGDEAFCGSAIKTIELPETLVSIGASAFERSKLVSVTIPKKITTI